MLPSWFTKKKKQFLSLRLIRKLARRPGWSGFSYTGVRKTHAKLFLQLATLINRKRERESSSDAFPCPNTSPFEEQDKESCWSPNWAPLNTCTPWSFFPVERASPGGNHIQKQLLDRRETHFPSFFLHSSQNEQIHLKKNISILPSLLQETYQRRFFLYT